MENTSQNAINRLKIYCAKAFLYCFVGMEMRKEIYDNSDGEKKKKLYGVGI